MTPDGSNQFDEAPKHSETAKDTPQGPKIARDATSWPLKTAKWPGASCPKTSGNVRKRPEMSGNVRRRNKMLGGALRQSDTL